MSLMDLDRCPRMKGRVRPEDLNTEACLKLAAEILSGAAEDYISTVRALRENPANRESAEHLRQLRTFYRSDYFTVLSAGTADGEAVMQYLNKQAGGEKA
ncbi:MAG: hypothetical protein IKD53_04535 [Clostridia bacterium]|nr:hypothetical protein [Clostridia bacterium]